MAKVVEPPVLISRILTFVFATSLVVLASLVITLIKMIPLQRPEVFFLYTPTRAANVVITPMSPDATNEHTIATYKEGFIREYIIARNTLGIGKNAYITRNNWNKIVQPWSNQKVYSDFKNTALYKQYMFNEMPPAISCSVNFSNSVRDKAIINLGKDTYEVKFTWYCKNENIGRQPTQKNYKIRIRIQSELDKKISGVLNNIEKLRENPLGIQVVEYAIKDGRGDPLNSDTEAW